MILIAGPCQHESIEHSQKMFDAIKEIVSGEFYYKASFDKANRSSIKGKRGVGLKQFVEDFEFLKNENPDMKLLTDVHECYQVEYLQDIIDVFQIPAFLCRQTDLIVEACSTWKPVNIKKGQFLSYKEVKGILSKPDPDAPIWITERGTTFGYNNLVVDMRGLSYMRQVLQKDYPNMKVIFDATHSVQEPGAGDGVSGGKRQFVQPLCRAAAAVGVDGFFMEVHDNPTVAPSDGPNMLTPNMFEETLRQIDKIQECFIT